MRPYCRTREQSEFTKFLIIPGVQQGYSKGIRKQLIKNYESCSIRIVNNLQALACRTTRWSKSYLRVSMPNSPCRHCVPSAKLQQSLGTQNKRLIYFGRAEVRVVFNDRAERYHSCNLVTERGPSSKQQQRCSPITNHQSPITNHQLPITNSLCWHCVPSSKLQGFARPLNYALALTNHQSPITNHQFSLQAPRAIR